jgi:hypothetical protein
MIKHIMSRIYKQVEIRDDDEIHAQNRGSRRVLRPYNI